MYRAPVLAPLIAAATLLAASPCAADQDALHPIDLRHEYGFGEGLKPCLDESLFRAALVMNTEHWDPFDPEQAKHLRTAVDWHMVRVRIVRKGRGYLGTVKAFNAEGDEVWSKKIETQRCEDVVDGLAFILSLGLDVSLVPPPAPPPPAPPEPSPAPAFVPAPPPHRPRPSVPVPLQAEPAGPLFWLGAGSFLALGRTPAGPSPGILVSGELGGSFFSVAMDMRFLPPVIPFDVESRGQSASLYFSAFTTSIAPCLHLTPLFVCLPLELGARDFRSTSNVSSDVVLPMMVGLGPRLGTEWAFSRHLSIRLYGDATGSFMKSYLAIGGHNIWREPVISGVVSVAVTFRLDRGNKR